MLSVLPWFLVESFPRHQYPLVSWYLEIKPSRFPCSLETRQIGFLSPRFHFPYLVGNIVAQLSMGTKRLNRSRKHETDCPCLPWFID